MNSKKTIIFSPVIETIENFIFKTIITKSTKESDQLDISLVHENPKIANEYLLTLINKFDNDGIKDRQLVYKSTMDFVDSRFEFLRAT